MNLFNNPGSHKAQLINLTDKLWAFIVPAQDDLVVDNMRPELRSQIAVVPDHREPITRKFRTWGTLSELLDRPNSDFLKQHIELDVAFGGFSGPKCCIRLVIDFNKSNRSWELLVSHMSLPGTIVAGQRIMIGAVTQDHAVDDPETLVERLQDEKCDGCILMPQRVNPLYSVPNSADMKRHTPILDIDKNGVVNLFLPYTSQKFDLHFYMQIVK